MTQASLDQGGAAEQRFEAYLDAITAVLGHADRTGPARAYCTGLLLPGERKSVEPMAARLAPDNVRRTHQSLHHFVAEAPWDDREILAAVSLSVSTWSSSLPIAWRLYLPEVWCQDIARCRKAGVPEGIAFQTKPEI